MFRQLLSSHLSLTKMNFNTPTTTTTITPQDYNDDDDEVTYHLITAPDLTWIPSSLRGRVDQHKAEFIDIIIYKRSNLLHPPYSLTISTHSPLLGNRLDARFTLTIQPLGPHCCRQTLVGTIKVSLLGLGAVIAHAVKDSLMKTYEKLPVIVEEYVAMRSEVIASGREEMLVVGVPVLQDTWLDIPWIHTPNNNNDVERASTVNMDRTKKKKMKMKMKDNKREAAVEIDVLTCTDGTDSSRENHALLCHTQSQTLSARQVDKFKQQFVQHLLRMLCIMALLMWVLLIRLHIITVASPSVRRRRAAAAAATAKRIKSKKNKNNNCRDDEVGKERGLRHHPLVGILPVTKRGINLSPLSLEAAKHAAAAAALPPEKREGGQRDPADVLRLARSQSLDTTWVKYKKEILDISL